MTEQDSHNKPELSTGMRIMPPEEIATDDLARKMAGVIAMDLVGKGMSKDELEEAYSKEYALRRNELEDIAGHEEPYAEQQIQSGEFNPEETN